MRRSELAKVREAIKSGDSRVERLVTTRIPTEHGELQMALFRDLVDGKEHVALIRSDIAGHRGVLVRLHSECFTGDLLGSQRCDCGPQLRQALEIINLEGRGVVLYLRQEGRGIGLGQKLRAYNLQDLGFDTVAANRMLGHAPDERDYSVAASILRHLGLDSVRLLTNNPAKIDGLSQHGIEVLERLPMKPPVTPENLSYLRTKARLMRHLFDPEVLQLPGLPPDDLASAAALEALGEEQVKQGQRHPASTVEALLAPVHERRRPSRPFFTLSYAQSVDGCIAAEAGKPLALSGRESLILTHRLRAAHDAILVGIGTVLADDPSLTVRLAEGDHPQPLVLDSELRFPEDAKMLRDGSGRSPWIFTGEDAPRDRQAELEGTGARVIRLPLDAPGRLSLEHLGEALVSEGVDSVMVEGGSRVISSFYRERKVDHLVLTVAPTLLGGLPALSRHSDDEPAAALPRLRNPRYEKLGEDLILWGEPEWQ